MLSATAPILSKYSAAYMALRLPSGTQVRRAGEAVSRGLWTVQDCTCPACMQATMLGAPASHYELHALGRTVVPLMHVSHTAVVPVLEVDEIFEHCTAITMPLTATHLRRLLRHAFPGVRFSVRQGKGPDRFRLSVHWAGGPAREAVAAVAAPLLADYATPGRRRPRPISVRRFGRTHTGTPMVDEIRLNRR
ncbi:LPD29 domain-containing protein [Streptomyces sp. bgisy154]|uniref:LPD29 domain-containing protein n=1 Tax=Streptomyces sp. bgisy154 TaxID=3413794 RepID=UPI003D726DA9